MSGTRVVLLALDGIGPEILSPELTPELWGLAARGGVSIDGGRAPLPSSTYPSLATLLTGADPIEHGVLTTARREGRLPRWAGSDRVRIRTLFDGCKAAGIPSAFVVGDHHLPAIFRPPADVRWPPVDAVPANVRRDAHGYPVNDAVLPHLLRACLGSELAFVFGHLNEADTVGHDLGPDDPRTKATYQATDAAVGTVAKALASSWERTVLIVVSDHGMESRGDAPPIVIELRDEVTDVLPDGGSALVRTASDPGLVRRRLIANGTAAAGTVLAPGLLLAVAPPGRLYAAAQLPARGFHGGRPTIPTLAIVAGGHPAVRAIARALEVAPPAQSDWAPTIAATLGIELHDARGVDLARPAQGAMA